MTLLVFDKTGRVAAELRRLSDVTALGRELDCKVEGVPSSAYPTPARCPADSQIDCSALEAALGVVRLDWRGSLAAMLVELPEEQYAA